MYLDLVSLLTEPGLVRDRCSDKYSAPAELNTFDWRLLRARLATFFTFQLPSFPL
jgi:hypothetical protein